jgi:hypothetical protein
MLEDKSKMLRRESPSLEGSSVVAIHTITRKSLSSTTTSYPSQSTPITITQNQNQNFHIRKIHSSPLKEGIDTHPPYSPWLLPKG